ncbi:MAG: hypothetical protein RIE60_17160, partial [Roseovarius sp.]
MIGNVKRFGKGEGIGCVGLAAVVALGLGVVPGGPARAAECLLDTNGNNLADTGLDTTEGANDNGVATATACGPNAAASEPDTVAVGNNTAASALGAISIGGDPNGSGLGTRASGVYAVAIGGDADADAAQAIAIGGEADASAAGA